MKFMFGAAVAALSVACATPASAQVTLEGNGARAEGEWGGELGVGYGFGAAGFKITPMVGAFIYSGDNDRYYEDANGGSARCRDSFNGQYADSDKCNNSSAKAYGKVEGTYSIPFGPTIGAGVRIGDDTKPYGTIAFPIAPTLKIKGNVGDGYYAIGIRLGL